MLYSRILVKGMYFFQGLFKEVNPSCPFCKNYNSRVVFKKYRVIEIRECADCHIFWTNPIFNFPNFYNWLYRAEGKTTDVSEHELSAMLKNNFLGSDKDYGKILDWIENNFEGKDLLEFGSSWGYFLKQAETRGFNSVGVEISDWRRNLGEEKLGVRIDKDLERIKKEDMKFDIIFSAHVLEHLGRQVSEVVSDLAGCLKPNGVMIFEVPELDLSKGAAAFGIMGAVHPLGFTAEFFKINMPKFGLAVEVFKNYETLVVGRENTNVIVAVCRKQK